MSTPKRPSAFVAQLLVVLGLRVSISPLLHGVPNAAKPQILVLLWHGMPGVSFL